MTLEDRIRQKFEDALRSWPAAGAGVHRHMLTVANLAAFLRLSIDEAERLILQTMPRVPSPANEVRTTLAKAYGEAVESGRTFERNPAPLPEMKHTREAMIRRGAGITEADWRDKSPIRLDWEPGYRDALAVLELYDPEEFLFIGERDGRTVREVHQWRRKIESCGCDGLPHVCPNPMSGEWGKTKSGNPSRRCDDTVAAFRYVVAEFDLAGLTHADQLAFWWGFKSTRIAALIDSGGKSIHAWLRVDCPDREAWTRDVENNLFKNVLVPLGMDPGCSNESRLSRLPGHFRKAGRMQRLLYLNPEA